MDTARHGHRTVIGAASLVVGPALMSIGDLLHPAEDARPTAKRPSDLATMARILLIRHGPSTHSTMPGLLDLAGVERWRAAYDAAGIAPDATPPAELLAQRLATLAVVTHGVMRRLLAGRLCRDGWAIHGRRRYAPWSLWELTKVALLRPHTNVQ